MWAGTSGPRNKKSRHRVQDDDGPHNEPPSSQEHHHELTMPRDHVNRAR
jgi:hypothetical protein